ncbi:hypothetical protein [Candidatus Magnetomonas plexicatena]|uniref:hypothetical protein n=1 Tax=Candidatus Magnetomonas plexicatena TaxID=2552947 RepID=UPI001C758882|nr:hypothetical protein E2O03_001770 [Nitrospirales bacterium LBB_01]
MTDKTKLEIELEQQETVEHSAVKKDVKFFVFLFLFILIIFSGWYFYYDLRTKLESLKKDVDAVSERSEAIRASVEKLSEIKQTSPQETPPPQQQELKAPPLEFKLPMHTVPLPQQEVKPPQ